MLLVTFTSWVLMLAPLHWATATARKREAEGSRSPTGGCCFAFGLGDWDKPCCLKTWIVADASNCPTAYRNGGATGFTTTTCPASADEAAALWLQDAAANAPQQSPLAIIAAPPPPKAPVDSSRAAFIAASPRSCCMLKSGASTKPWCLEVWLRPVGQCAATMALSIEAIGSFGLVGGVCMLILVARAWLLAADSDALRSHLLLGGGAEP